MTSIAPTMYSKIVSMALRIAKLKRDTLRHGSRPVNDCSLQSDLVLINSDQVVLTRLRTSIVSRVPPMGHEPFFAPGGAPGPPFDAC
jgi:hypothetical protein